MLLTTLIWIACTADPPGTPGGAPAPGGAPEPAGGAPPDIVLITVDTWRADRLHLYGGERQTSPAVEALAEGSVIFDRAIAPAPWTLPSLSSVMTGRYPEAHTVTGASSALPEGAVTLAERLSGAGYEAAFFGVNTYLMPSRGLGQGFEPYRAWDGLDGRELVRTVARYLDQRRREEPLFLAVHLYDPHCPYQAPRALRGRWREVPAALRTGRALSPEQWASMPACYQLRTSDGDDAVPGQQGAPVLALDSYLAAYDEELLATDQVIGELLGVLDDRRLLERSLLILAGDHGEAFWEHGDYGHGREVYQTTIRVPLLIRPPGGADGRRVGTPVSLVELAPTVLRAAGQPVDQSLVGRDLSPAWGAGLTPAPIFSHTRYEGADASAVLDGELALLRGGGRTLLYDLAADPGQREDLSAARPGEVTRLLGLLDEQLQVDRRAAAELVPRTLSPAEDVLQQLKSIGYLQ